MRLPSYIDSGTSYILIAKPGIPDGSSCPPALPPTLPPAPLLPPAHDRRGTRACRPLRGPGGGRGGGRQVFEQEIQLLSQLGLKVI